MRPAYVDQYIQADKLEKEAKAIKTKLREDVESYLRENPNDADIRYSVSTSETIDESVFLAWAYQNLPKEQYEDLFAKVFDPNKVTEKIRHGIIKEDNLPAGYKVRTETVRVTVKGTKESAAPTAAARRKVGAKK